MSTDPSNRRCGSCGEPVDAADTTCPRCGALLAAYEAPAGSEAVTDPIKTASPMPAPPAPEVQASSQQRDDAAVPEAPHPMPKPASTHVDVPPKAPPIELASSRKKAQRVPPQAEPVRRTESRQARPETKRTSSRGRPATAKQLSTREVASTAASFGKLALGVLMILVVLGILDFDLVPILVLGVVLLSLLGIMRSAAKASGRKTTSMHDPNRDNLRR